jgi:hypothetical protein
MHRPWIPALLLLGLLVAFRCLGAAFALEMPNFQPLAALFLCGAVFFHGAKSWGLPVVAWLLSYPATSWVQGYQPFSHAGDYVALGTLLLTSVLARPLRQHRHPALLLGAGVLAAALFHVLTNSAAWVADPLHAKTAAGYWQALWSGRPTDPLPTWIFFRNQVAANLLFTTLFLVAHHSWRPARKVLPAIAQHR